MLRFIICEDNKEHLDRLCNIINKVMMPYNFEYKINKFTQYQRLQKIKRFMWQTLMFPTMKTRLKKMIIRQNV